MGRVAMKVVCKLNNCIQIPGQAVKCMWGNAYAVAKRVSQLTLPNCSVATCFAAGKTVQRANVEEATFVPLVPFRSGFY